MGDFDIGNFKSSQGLLNLARGVEDHTPGLLGLDYLVAKSCLFGTPLAEAHQVPLSMRFPRQEYWRGLPLPSPGDLPNPGTESTSSALEVDSLLFELPGEVFEMCYIWPPSLSKTYLPVL